MELITALREQNLPPGPYPPVDPAWHIRRMVQVLLPNAPEPYTWLIVYLGEYSDEPQRIIVYNGLKGFGPVEIPPDHPWVRFLSYPLRIASDPLD